LLKAVFEYTRDTTNSLREAGAFPDMVRIGNEITNGILWRDGKLPGNWDHFADLVKAGINGVDVGHGNEPRPKIMIHIDRGGDEEGTKHFFDKLVSCGVPFDVIGQSYYSWWHGTLNDLRQNLYLMATQYHKDIVLAEVA
jgi:arabinogalactan endo-1,4-beta-galactosidase